MSRLVQDVNVTVMRASVSSVQVSNSKWDEDDEHKPTDFTFVFSFNRTEW